MAGASEHINGYHDLVPVGHGGFSVVYQARQDDFDRTVAVKVLAVDARDEKAMRRFARECQLTGRLSGHPNIVTVLGNGQTSAGRPYIAMEFYPDGSLKQRLLREGPLPVRDVLDIGVKVAGALAAAHAAGVLHRDVKPENVLLSPYGEPALADFGVSRLTAALGGSASTQALTPHHAAPEVLDGRPATAAADVYSLGSTLYQLLAGRPAFQPDADEGIAPMLLRILRDEPPPIARPDVPEPVLAVLRRAMAKQPADRFPDAPALGTALRAAQAGAGLPVTRLPYDPAPHPVPAGAGADEPATTAPPPAPSIVDDVTMDRQAQTWLRDRPPPAPAPPPQRPDRPARRWRRPALAAGLAALLVAATMVGLGLGLGRRGHPPLPAAAAQAAAPSSAAPSRSASPTPTPGPAAAAAPAAPVPATPTHPRDTGQAGGRVTPAQLGPPDFDGYCRATGQGPVKLVSSNAYGWHCSADNGTGDDAQAVCGWTYHTTKVANRVADFNNPGTWQCWRSNGKLGALDFNAYCQDLGFSGAYLVPDRYAYGWFCTGSPNGIDSQAACKRLYGSDPPISRFQNFYDHDSWQCWG
jgi:serine/threonine protein kinase